MNIDIEGLVTLLIRFQAYGIHSQRIIIVVYNYMIFFLKVYLCTLIMCLWKRHMLS